MFTLYLFISPLIAILLITINLLLTNNNSYIEKDSPFECGFSSYQQSRSSFSVSFILVAILFLPFDLEISSLLPFVVSAYLNSLYGLVILIIFFLSLVFAFVFEYNLDALVIKHNYKSYVTPLIKYLY